jgi:hypothetical protein
MKTKNNKLKKATPVKMVKIPESVALALADIALTAAEIVDRCSFTFADDTTKGLEYIRGPAISVNCLDINMLDLCDLANKINELDKLERVVEENM